MGNINKEKEADIKFNTETKFTPNKISDLADFKDYRNKIKKSVRRPDDDPPPENCLAMAA